MNASTQAPPHTSEAEEFLNSTAHVPDEIPAGENPNKFADIGQPEIIEPGGTVTGWTVEAVANIFSGIFSALVFVRVVVPFGGEHWNIPRDKVLQLAQAWLPIFVKHIPYESAPTWLPDVLLYCAVIGTTREILGPALKIEIDQARANAAKNQQRQRQHWNAGSPGNTSRENTRTATPQESPGQSESDGAVRPSDSGFRSNFASVD